jgi:hypothetical protein
LSASASSLSSDLRAWGSSFADGASNATHSARSTVFAITSYPAALIAPLGNISVVM